MFTYSNIIALIKSQLRGGEVISNISGFVNGFTFGSDPDYPDGISILHTANDIAGWNGQDNIVFTEKIDGAHLLQFESDVLSNTLYTRTWYFDSAVLSDTFDGSSLDANRWSLIAGNARYTVTGGYLRIYETSANSDYRTIRNNYDLTGDFSVEIDHDHNAGVEVFVDINGQKYSLFHDVGTFGGTYNSLAGRVGWLYEGSIVSSTPVSNIRRKFKLERVGGTLNYYYTDTDINTYVLAYSNTVSSDDAQLYLKAEGLYYPTYGEALFYDANITISQGETTVNSWSNWKTVNKSSDVTFTPYGNIQSTTLQAALEEINDEFVTTTSASNTYATQAYVDSIVENLDWQPSVIDFYDPSTSLPGTPNDGDRYISLATANGWTEDYIYEWDATNTQWVETIPNEGFVATNENDDIVYHYLNNEWVVLQGAGGVIWQEMNSTTLSKELESGYGYFMEGDAVYTVTLPPLPELGDEVTFLYNIGDFVVNNVTIARNGENIESLAEDLTINVDDFSFSLVYVDAVIGWRFRE